MRKPFYLLASSLVVGILSAASPICRADDAATAPANGGGDWFRNQPPANQPGAPDQSRRVFAPYNNNNNSNDYPSRDVQEWVFANTRAATARALFSRAENDLAAAFSRAQHSFEHSKGYRDAVAEEKDAYENYNATRQRALHDLNNDPKYRELIKLCGELTDKISVKRISKETTSGIL